MLQKKKNSGPSDFISLRSKWFSLSSCVCVLVSVDPRLHVTFMTDLVYCSTLHLFPRLLLSFLALTLVSSAYFHFIPALHTSLHLSSANKICSDGLRKPLHSSAFNSENWHNGQLVKYLFSIYYSIIYHDHHQLYFNQALTNFIYIFT